MAKRELTPQQETFLSALLGEAQGDFRTAMKIAGYAETTRPSDVIKTLRDEIINIAKDTLALNSAKAVHEMLDVMINPAKAGSSIKLKAAQQVLDRVGIASNNDSVDLKVPSGGLLILPAKSTKEDKEDE